MKYTLIQTPHRRTVSIRISDQSEVIVRASTNVSKLKIDEIVSKHHPWIEKQLQKTAVQMQIRKATSFENTNKFYYLGKIYPLKIIPSRSRSIKFDDAFISPTEDRIKLRRYLTKWYKIQAEIYLKFTTLNHADKYNFKFSSIKILGARKRLGSCTSRNEIRLTWRLILAPPQIVDYVILHELTHTKHHNHSRQFWNELSKIHSTYKEDRTWIRKNSYIFETT